MPISLLLTQICERISLMASTPEVDAASAIWEGVLTSRMRPLRCLFGDYLPPTLGDKFHLSH